MVADNGEVQYRGQWTWTLVKRICKTKATEEPFYNQIKLKANP